MRKIKKEIYISILIILIYWAISYSLMPIICPFFHLDIEYIPKIGQIDFAFTFAYLFFSLTVIAYNAIIKHQQNLADKLKNLIDIGSRIF